MRPTVVRAEIESALALYRLGLDDHPVIVVGLRGGLASSGNKIGGFDDALVVVTASLCEAFTGNTDPSTEIVGRANLVTGISWFKPGFHHPGTPKQYAAFVQDGPIIVKRHQTDDVQAGTKDPSMGVCQGAGLWKGDFAIHMHDAMGVNTTGSEGCQTVIKTEWPSFHSLLLDELIKAVVPAEKRALSWEKLADLGLLRFPYLLVEGVKAHRAAAAVA